MRLNDKIRTAATTGYILLWLLGIPIQQILFLILEKDCVTRGFDG
jgi:hypothetical protein